MLLITTGLFNAEESPYFVFLYYFQLLYFKLLVLSQAKYQWLYFKTSSGGRWNDSRNAKAAKVFFELVWALWVSHTSARYMYQTRIVFGSHIILHWIIY
jgi:hypothetical protein